MKNIVVFGASGQLGQCIKTVAAANETPAIIFPAESDANILNTEDLKRMFDEHQPAWVINCAAYTAVDKAEDEAGIAEKVNKTGSTLR